MVSRLLRSKVGVGRECSVANGVQSDGQALLAVALPSTSGFNSEFSHIALIGAAQ